MMEFTYDGWSLGLVADIKQSFGVSHGMGNGPPVFSPASLWTF